MRFSQVDVFSSEPLRGNALAVVHDADGVSDDDMAAFARWTNLSETTFMLAPTSADADYRVRIWTPGGELPFAGHPTLGTCHAWLQAGGQPRAAATVVQQSAVGLVRIRRDGERLSFAAPPLRRSAPSPSTLAQVASALGLKSQQIVSAQVLDNGPVWFTLLLDDAQTVLRLEPNHLTIKALGHKIGVAALTQEEAAPLIARGNREARAFGASGASGARAAAAPALVVRAFAACAGVNEDPVTGSLNASLAQWLLADEVLPAPYTASQGACLGRDGLVHITQDESGQVWVGGMSVTCIAGTVDL